MTRKHHVRQTRMFSWQRRLLHGVSFIILAPSGTCACTAFRSRPSAPLRGGASFVKSTAWTPIRSSAAVQTNPIRSNSRCLSECAAHKGPIPSSDRRWMLQEASLITSPDNPRIKYMRTMTRKRIRDEEGLVLVEGHRLLLDALEAKRHPTAVLVCPEAFQAPLGSQLQNLLELLPSTSILLTTAPLVAKACDTMNPQGVVALIPRPADALETESPPQNANRVCLALVLDAIQDPGNLGTLIRTGVGFGVSEIFVLGKGSCDPWSPKALRAAMGASFRMKGLMEVGAWKDIQNVLQRRYGLSPDKRDWVLLAADSTRDGICYDAVDMTGPVVLIVGSEAHGLSPEVRQAMHRGEIRGVRIPLTSGIESLNAAAAGAVLLGEAARQRRQSTG